MSVASVNSLYDMIKINTSLGYWWGLTTTLQPSSPDVYKSWSLSLVGAKRNGTYCLQWHPINKPPHLRAILGFTIWMMTSLTQYNWNTMRAISLHLDAVTGFLKFILDVRSWANSRVSSVAHTGVRLMTTIMQQGTTPALPTNYDQPC